MVFAIAGGLGVFLTLVSIAATYFPYLTGFTLLIIIVSALALYGGKK